MKARLTTLFASQPRAHWENVFADTDDCVWPVLTMAEARQHPHHQARASFIELAGVAQPAPAPRLSRTPAQVQEAPPVLGEHTVERLQALGLTAVEIERLVALGAVSLMRST